MERGESRAVERNSVGKKKTETTINQCSCVSEKTMLYFERNDENETMQEILGNFALLLYGVDSGFSQWHGDNSAP